MVAAQDIHSVQTAFTKTTLQGSETEHIEGTLYFQADHGTIIQVTVPLRQWLVLRKNSLLIYYPDDEYAFRISTQLAMTFPFFQAFMGVMSEDFGLTQLGYFLKDNSMRNDTLVTVWTLPQKITPDVGDFVLRHFGDKIVQAELQNTDGTVVSSSFFSDHLRYKSYYFPCDIKTHRYTDTDTTHEHIVFIEPRFNTGIPDSILHFRLPNGVEVQQEDW